MAVQLEAISRWVGSVASTTVRASRIWRVRSAAGVVCPGGRGTASGAVALIEVEVRDGLGLRQVIVGRLVDVEAGVGVEAEVVLGRAACGREGRRCGGQAEVAEDEVHGLGSGNEGEDAHLGAAAGAAEREDLVDAGEQAGPAGAGGGALRRVRRVGRRRLSLRDSRGVGRTGVFRAGAGIDRQLVVVAAHGDDPGAECGVRREDAVVAVAVDAGRRDETADGGEKFEGREGEDGATVGRGPRRVVEDLADGGPALTGGGGRMVLDAQALEGEGRPGAVSEQPLSAGGVGAMDANGGVQADRSRPAFD